MRAVVVRCSFISATASSASRSSTAPTMAMFGVEVALDAGKRPRACSNMHGKRNVPFPMGIIYLTPSLFPVRVFG